MDINNRGSLIYQVSCLNNEQLNDVDLSFHLVRKQADADNLYQSLEVQLASDVRSWVTKNTIRTLKGLRQVDETDTNVFNVGDYNHEISPNDKIAKFTLNEVMLDKKGKLITTLNSSDPEFPEKETDFQIAKLSYGGRSAYL